MNKENFEGAARSAFGQGDQIGGNMPKDKPAAAQGRYDEVVGQAQSAVGSAKDALVASGGDAASSIDLSGVRDEIAKLAQTVTDLVQKQASTTRDQVRGAVGAAGDNLSQSASVAQDKLISMEEDIGSRIRKNPWSAVAIAALVGLLIGKMT
jgi:ElaB/YqjD/DUF883 family membrane-anchored ribosome-binding protein/uncharacterized protein YjbJ (UPF0337 family)